VELLVVIAIIGILAALLLPVLNGGQRRAQRIFCENNLREVGIAFHVFSNDHTGKFPMDVSTNDGGSMEYIENGYSAGKIFYTTFRSFQSLSNELVKPEILICPSDTTRGAASNFPALQNQNLCYFIGASGTFDKPGSILAGDRNLVTNAYETPTILQIGPGSRLSWTWEMHQFQGNILFGDGHVEEWNQSGLKTGEDQFSPDEKLFLPSVATVVNLSYGGSGSGPDNGGNGNNGGNTYNGGNPGNGANAGQSASSSSYQPSAAVPMQPASVMSPASPDQLKSGSETSHQPIPQAVLPAPGSESSSETAAETTTTVTNAVVAVAIPGDEMMATFDQHLTKTLQHTFEWLYLLLLLLALLYLAYKIRKWMREREAKMNAKRLPDE